MVVSSLSRNFVNLAKRGRQKGNAPAGFSTTNKLIFAPALTNPILLLKAAEDFRCVMPSTTHIKDLHGWQKLRGAKRPEPGTMQAYGFWSILNIWLIRCLLGYCRVFQAQPNRTKSGTRGTHVKKYCLHQQYFLLFFKPKQQKNKGSSFVYNEKTQTNSNGPTTILVQLSIFCLINLTNFSTSCKVTKPQRQQEKNKHILVACFSPCKKKNNEGPRQLMMFSICFLMPSQRFLQTFLAVAEKRKPREN